MKVNLGPIEEIDTHLMFTWRNDSAVTKYLARKSMSRADVNIGLPTSVKGGGHIRLKLMTL